METGKTMRYFKYAIGEILLVMVGILLALQVNNWNEQRKQNKLELNYLLALKDEFQYNLKDLERVIALNDRNMENAQKLAKYTGPGAPKITDVDFSKLIFKVLTTEVQYRPGSGVINEIINSGKLSIFRNQELKKALASLDGILLKVRFQEKEEHGKERNDLISMLKSDSVSIRKMVFEASGEAFGLNQGNFTDSNLHLLQSKKFDNYLSGFIYTSGFLGINYYNKLKEQIENVIQIIDNQLI